MITGSIVTYNNSKSEIKNVISSFLSCKEKVKLFIVDNSKKIHLKRYAMMKELNIYLTMQT